MVHFSDWLLDEGIFDRVGLTTELQEPPVVDQPLDDGSGHVVVPEHRSPARKLQIYRDDQAPFFIPVRDHLEEKSGPFGIDRDVAQLIVNGQELVLAREASSLSRRSSSLARRSIMTRAEVVKNLAWMPCRQAAATRAVAMCVLPVPTSP